MKHSHFTFMVFIGTLIEVAIIVLLILHKTYHPIFPVLVGAWGFVAGVTISNYKELTNG